MKAHNKNTQMDKDSAIFLFHAHKIIALLFAFSFRQQIENNAISTRFVCLILEVCIF